MVMMMFAGHRSYKIALTNQFMIRLSGNASVRQLAVMVYSIREVMYVFKVHQPAALMDFLCQREYVLRQRIALHLEP